MNLKNFSLAVVAVVLAVALSARADLLNGFPNVQSLTTNTITLTAGSTTNLVGTYTPGDKGFAIWPYFAGNGAGTSNLLVMVYPSWDNTNFATVAVSTNAVTMNGTVGVRGYVLVPPTVLNHALKCQVTLSNSFTGTLWITNVTATSWR